MLFSLIPVLSVLALSATQINGCVLDFLTTGGFILGSLTATITAPKIIISAPAKLILSGTD